METNCPQGWKHVRQFGNITWEDSRVNIYEGICDSTDRCGIDTCPYYDTSKEATRIFLKASAHEHTIEGLLESKEDKQRHLQPRPRRGKEPHWDSGADGLPDAFNTAFDDLLARGLIQEAGFNAEGEITHQLTTKKMKKGAGDVRVTLL